MQKKSATSPLILVAVTSGGMAALLLAAWSDPAVFANRNERNQVLMGSALLLLATFVGVNAWSKLKRDEMEERRAGFDVMTTMTLDAWRPSSPPLVAGDLLENHIVIVHFWAPWNAQDREIDVALTAFASRRNVCLRSCNVDDVENQQFAEDVANIPYLKIYVRGEAKAAYVGRWTTDALEELLENAQSGEQV